VLISQKLLVPTLPDDSEGQTVLDLDVDDGVTHSNQMIEKILKFSFQREVGAVRIWLPRRPGSHLDCLNDARLWVIAWEAAANRKALDLTKPESFDNLYSLALTRIQRALSHAESPSSSPELRRLALC
jgi:hypothetical protein